MNRDRSRKWLQIQQVRFDFAKFAFLRTPLLVVSLQRLCFVSFFSHISINKTLSFIWNFHPYVPPKKNCFQNVVSLHGSESPEYEIMLSFFWASKSISDLCERNPFCCRIGTWDIRDKFPFSKRKKRWTKRFFMYTPWYHHDSNLSTLSPNSPASSPFRKTLSISSGNITVA